MASREAAAPAAAATSAGAGAKEVAPSLPGSDDKLATEKTLGARPSRKAGESGGAASKVAAGRQR
jgi:hypothetical protein